jgi:STE24 endopeptidase
MERAFKSSWVVVAICLIGLALPALAAAPVPAVAVPPVTPKMRVFSEIGYALEFLVPIYSLMVVWFILASRASARMRSAAFGLTHRRFLTLAWYLGFYTITVFVLNLPVNIAAGYWLEHAFGLSHESFFGWAGDDTKQSLVNFAIRLPVLWVVFELMRRWPRNWEFRFWLALIPLIAIGIFAQPLIVDPVMNKFTPLPPGPLRTQIQALAAKAGIPNAPILVADMSRQTEETNAYVDGIGSSARIVLWDTTLKKMPEDQIISVVGHEMGHYVLKHIYWGFLGAVALLLVTLPLARRFYDFLVDRIGPRAGIDGPTDFAAAPLLIATMIVFNFLLAPVTNAASRVIEHQADSYGLRVTRNGPAMARAFAELSRDNLSDPDPPAFIQFWFGSHPTLKERIEFVLGRNQPANR